MSRSDLPVLLVRPPALAVGRSGEERSFDCRGIVRPRTLALLATALVVSMIVFAVSRGSTGSGRRTYDRQATDSQGRSTAVHEEVH